MPGWPGVMPLGPNKGRGAFSPLGTTWVQAGRLDELVPGNAVSVQVFGKKYALYSVDGEVFATADACPHAGGSLGEGELDGHTISCPFHSFEYDVRTGKCTSGQDLDVASVRVRLDDNLILLEV